MGQPNLDVRLGKCSRVHAYACTYTQPLAHTHNHIHMHMRAHAIRTASHKKQHSGETRKVPKELHSRTKHLLLTEVTVWGQGRQAGVRGASPENGPTCVLAGVSNVLACHGVHVPALQPPVLLKARLPWDNACIAAWRTSRPADCPKTCPASTASRPPGMQTTAAPPPPKRTHTRD